VVRKHNPAVPDQRAALAELRRTSAFKAADPAVQRWIVHLLGGKFRQPADKQKILM
jgi:hypothetical protein